MKNSFSVLMSVYKKDDAFCLKEALESVFAQTCPPAEVVLVSDGPLTPQLDTVLDSYKDKCKIIRLPQNMGLGTALQTGLKECSHPLTARMDSDDICQPDRFELQLAAFEKDKNLSICGGAIEEIDFKTKETIALRRLPQTDAEIKRFLKLRCPFNHMTVMFKKADILSCGGYEAKFLMEDYSLWVHCAAKGLKMYNLPQVLVRARMDAKSYQRRGSYKYFKSNKALQDEMLALGVISLPTYLFNLFIRFAVQVILPNSLRSLFYKKALRSGKNAR